MVATTEANSKRLSMFSTNVRFGFRRSYPFLDSNNLCVDSSYYLFIINIAIYFNLAFTVYSQCETNIEMLLSIHTT